MYPYYYQQRPILTVHHMAAVEAFGETIFGPSLAILGGLSHARMARSNAPDASEAQTTTDRYFVDIVLYYDMQVLTTVTIVIQPFLSAKVLVTGAAGLPDTCLIPTVQRQPRSYHDKTLIRAGPVALSAVI